MNVICRIVDPCDLKINFIIICRSVTYISWSIDFTLYFKDYLMDECHICDTKIGLIKFI